MAETALDTAELVESLRSAVDRADAPIASVTREIGTPIDPAAIAFGSRRAGDRWFCWEQPDREGFALAGFGTAAEVISRGPDRFRDVAARCAELSGRISRDEPDDLPAGAGPVFVGGFSFAPAGGSRAQWSSLPPALMFLPEVALWRRGGRRLLTATVAVNAGRSGVERLGSRLLSLEASALTPADPHPSGRVTISSEAPAAYERTVAEAVERIRAGRLEKAVLAREVLVEAPAAHDLAGLFGALRLGFPSCFCFCVGTPEAAFIGASPELLVRRSGAVAATVALAGSTRRSADPAVDDHLGQRLLRSAKDRSEHQIVVRRIERSLRPHSVWVQADEEPSLALIANIQHLATPIRAQLTEPRSAVELAGLLHPTPAVGGEPPGAAIELIDSIEGLDRGWYAGPVGWMDLTEDGEFCVGLRSALIRDRTARLYAGCGIVADSDPAAELAETEIKLDALLPLLAG